MKPTQQEVGRRIFLMGLIELEEFNYPTFYFLAMKKYRLSFNIKNWKFSRCECVHGAIWGVNKPEEHCKHEIAAKEWLRENAEIYIKNWRKQKCSVQDVKKNA